MGLSVINFLVLCFFVSKLPFTVPVHLNANMVIDGWGSKYTILIFSAFPILFNISIKYFGGKVSKNIRVENILFPVISVFFIAVTWFVYLIGLQFDAPAGVPLNFPMNLVIGLPLGLLMIILSNYMGVIKYNRYLGVRTPWTLKNEEVWKKTHRISGYTGVVGGIIICIFSVLSYFLNNNLLVIIGVLVGVFFIAIIPMIYSYIIYKKLGL